MVYEIAGLSMSFPLLYVVILLCCDTSIPTILTFSVQYRTMFMGGLYKDKHVSNIAGNSTIISKAFRVIKHILLTTARRQRWGGVYTSGLCQYGETDIATK